MDIFLKRPLVGLCFFTMKPSAVNHFDAQPMLKGKKKVKSNIPHIIIDGLILTELWMDSDCRAVLEMAGLWYGTSGGFSRPSLGPLP